MCIKTFKGIGIFLIALIMLATVLFGYYKLCMDPYRGTIKYFESSKPLDEMFSRDQALEDINYLMKCLRQRHPAWIEGEGKNEPVEQQYMEEVARIGDEVSELELYRSVSRILATLHDGHTRTNWYGENGYLYTDDSEAIPSGGKPIAINKTPIGEVLAAFKEHFSYELDFYAEKQFFDYAIWLESTLQLCGIDTYGGVTMTYEMDGKPVEVQYDIVSFEELETFETGQGKEQDTKKWVSYEIDKENGVGIFTLTTCDCNEEYLSVLDSFFQEVFAEGIENIVVDLRGNGGGDSWVANEFLTYIDIDTYRSWDGAVRYGWYLHKNNNVSFTNQKKEQVFDGAIYVLTDTWTYSSAMDFAMLIADNDLGVIVGEPSGNLPDSYGDILRFQTPNAKLPFTVSFKRWYRIDRDKAGEPMIPDIQVEAEQALEKVYETIQRSN